MIEIPKQALSIRQPWAWAIVHGGKDIENRSSFAVSKAGFDPRRIAVHASKGMTRDDYEGARDMMEKLGVKCPRPDALIRGAIIGAVTVQAIVNDSDSPWFLGHRGLVLVDAEPCEPTPALGALGYFYWDQGGGIEAPLPWMMAWPDLRGSKQRSEPTPAAMPLFG